MSIKYIGVSTLGSFLARLYTIFADRNHDHDTRYYVQDDVDAKVAAINANIANTQSDIEAHANSVNEHFTAEERTKLAGIEDGAQVNLITGIKGENEEGFREGNVEITKANIGLGNVDNTSDDNKPVSIAQQKAIDDAIANSKAYAKSYTDIEVANLLNNSSTAVDSIMELAIAMEENEDVVSALNLAVGTKADANELANHIGAMNNPHNVTTSQLGITASTEELNYMTGVTSNVQTQLSGKAALTHNHATSEITSGTLGVARGGTGAATHTTNAVLAGNGTSAVKNIATASGALYATAANGVPAFGTLPVAQGGTGATTASGALANLGITLSTSAAPSTGTPNSIHIQLL